MATGRKFTSHEQYIEASPRQAQDVLRKVQAIVEAAVPSAERCISYNIPAYRTSSVFFYFAAFKSHLGVFPPVRADAKLVRRLEPYSNEKGNLRFEYEDSIPYDLIRSVAIALAHERSKDQAKRPTRRASRADSAAKQPRKDSGRTSRRSPSEKPSTGGGRSTTSNVRIPKPRTKSARKP